VYVVGNASGALPGQTYSGGSYDAFIRKYDLGGTELWTRQFGTSGFDNASGVAVDTTGVYVVGQTDRALVSLSLSRLGFCSMLPGLSSFGQLLCAPCLLYIVASNNFTGPACWKSDASLRAELQEYSHCETVTDCTIVYGSRCGYRSGLLTNKYEVDRVMPLIGSCAPMECHEDPAFGTVLDVTCIDHQCRFKARPRLTPKISQPITTIPTPTRPHPRSFFVVALVKPSSILSFNELRPTREVHAATPMCGVCTM
jgi:hypothetical protein